MLMLARAMTLTLMMIMLIDDFAADDDADAGAGTSNGRGVTGEKDSADFARVETVSLHGACEIARSISTHTGRDHITPNGAAGERDGFVTCEVKE